MKLFLFLFIATFAWSQSFVTKGEPLPEKTIYLTFDDGPGPETEHLVSILEDKGVRATFFINSYDTKVPLREVATSNRLTRYKDLLLREIAEGNVLGNHTFSHRDLAWLTPEQIKWQLEKNQENLNEVVPNYQFKLMRPPFGSPWEGLGTIYTPDMVDKLSKVLEEENLIPINWNVDSSDSSDWVVGEGARAADPSNMVNFTFTKEFMNKAAREIKRLWPKIQKGESMIILFHDTHPTSVDILPGLIDYCLSLGYKFDTLDHYVDWRKSHEDRTSTAQR